MIIVSTSLSSTPTDMSNATIRGLMDKQNDDDDERHWQLYWE
jgi:hypothetical protein